MRRRESRVVSVAALLVTFGIAFACFMLGLNAESTAMRAVDGAIALLDLGAATALSFLIWPAR